MYTVKEVAEMLGVSVHTVRYYDDKGLIPGTKRNAANQRLFDDMEVEWLFVSLTLKNTGLSLKDVKHYIDLYQQGDSTLSERYKLMTEQKEKTLLEMEELKLRLAVLDRKIDHYGKLLDGEEDTWSHEYMQKLIREGADHE
jgi:DNA-binding transcriptional MerR regulator